ncbi:hypothetical protein BHM03_00035528 [Ensete ventricosum]|nr:hypothetical protein BHM03_00035528 [Ensete ventricosum]
MTRKFKILAILDVLAHGKSYEHDFAKNVAVINFAQIYGKSYEHGFVKNVTVINFAQSHARSRLSIDFSCLEIKNTGHSQRISALEVYEHGFLKKSDVINFTQSLAYSGVSIGFSCTLGN